MTGRFATIIALIAANLLGFSFAGLVMELHQLRPDGIIELHEAEFVSSNSPGPPDYTAAEKISLPDDWVTRPIAGNVNWYRLSLELNVAPNSLWGMYIPALEMAPAVFINGDMLGGSVETLPLQRFWQRPVMYSIANGILKPGTNFIDVRLAANGKWGRLTEIYLGPHEIVAAAYAPRYFWRTTFVNYTMAISFAIALFMLTTFVIRRDSVYGWFAAFSATLGVQNLFYLVIEPPVPTPVWDFLVYLLMGTLVLTGTVFTYRFLDVSRPGSELLLKRTYCLGLLALLPWIWIDPVLLNTLGSQVWLLLVLLCSLLPVGALVQRTFSNLNAEVFALVTVYCAMIALGVHDWIVTIGAGDRHDGHLLQFATAPTLLTFGSILLRRFIAAMRETDALNRELEDRVAAKTQAFEESFALSQQLQSEKLLSVERERIMREVHDGVGGQLIGALSRLDLQTPRERSLAEDLQAALRDLRLTIDSLDSVEGDLTTALGLLRNRLQDQLDDSGIRLIWEVGDLPQVAQLGPERVLHILRIAQEAITNAVRHSGCRSIRVRTQADDRINNQPCLTITIEDDGCGLVDGKHHGRGLKNMHYRSEQAGLLFEIVSSGGTRVRLGILHSDVAQTQNDE